MLNVKKKLEAFKKNENGNFALMSAFMILPMTLAAGIAVDYTTALKNRTELQNALDQAALAAGVEDNLDIEDRELIATNMFEAATESLSVEATPVFTIDNQTITATLSAESPTVFGGLYGQSSIGISVGTEIKYAVESAAEVAMVLDYSGSMGWNNKWSTMRDAAKDLIDILGEDGERDDIKFALAPFSRLMHTSLPSGYVVGETAGSTWTGCTQDRKWPHNISEDTPVSHNDDTKWGLTPSASDWHCTDHVNRGLTVRPLSDDHDQVKTWLDGMSPGGNTHISLGLSYGWHLVSPGEPFSEGVAYETDGTKKFIVLLTDGAQTQNAWGSSDTYKVSNGEANLEDLCAAVKNKDVFMITIAFDLNDGATKNRLKDCATNAGYFFEADSNAELATAFQTVAALIQGSLHISK